MNVTVCASRKTYTGLDATVASILIDCGLVSAAVPEAIKPAPEKLEFTLAVSAVSDWARATFKERPVSKVAYLAARLHFKPPSSFMRLKTNFGNEPLFNNKIRYGLLSAFPEWRKNPRIELKPIHFNMTEAMRRLAAIDPNKLRHIASEDMWKSDGVRRQQPFMATTENAWPIYFTEAGACPKLICENVWAVFNMRTTEQLKACVERVENRARQL